MSGALAMELYLGILQGGRALNDYEYLVKSQEAMFDHVMWRGEASEGAAKDRGRERACGPIATITRP